MKIRRGGEATLRSYCKLETTVEYKNSKTMLQIYYLETSHIGFKHIPELKIEHDELEKVEGLLLLLKMHQE